MESDFISKKAFVPVPPSQVITSRGTEQTGAFVVSVYPVTIGDFTWFCSETGYRSEAELSNSPQTYKHYPRLAGNAKHSRIPISEVNGAFLSYNDALAFCEWAKVAIPTDAEWVAASIVDWSVVFPDAFTGYHSVRSRARIRQHGDEWTSTPAKDTNPTESAFELPGYKRPDIAVERHPDDMTIRRGPVYALFEGWDKIAMTMWAPRKFYSQTVGFRVIIRE